jgi:Ferritin-like domain
MKFLSIAVGALLAMAAAAAPIEERQSNTDVTVLQFALTLEHLENVFYKEALGNFTQQMFIDAGYSATYYNNIKYIATDEEQHVLFLQSAIKTAGYTPVAACSYNFKFTDVRSFITLSSVLEGVGTSAYLGAAGLITSKAYLTAAGSILVTEALHTSMQRGAIGEVPMANPYGTPLDPTAVFTLAASFIVSCPPTNAALPFTAFPSLALDGAFCSCEEPNCTPSQITKREPWDSWEATSTYSAPAPSPTAYCSPPMASATIMLTAAKNIPSGSYVTFVSGLMIVSAKPSKIDGANIYVTIPSAAQGQTYVFITNSDIEGTFTDSAVLYGPAIVESKL